MNDSSGILTRSDLSNLSSSSCSLSRGDGTKSNAKRSSSKHGVNILFYFRLINNKTFFSLKEICMQLNNVVVYQQLLHTVVDKWLLFVINHTGIVHVY